VAVFGLPPPFLPVGVYVVVAAGVIVTAVPLVTAPTLLLTDPVPPANTAVSVVEFPAVMVACPARKLVIAGAATTVSFAAVVVAVPTELVNVARYWFPVWPNVTAGVNVSVADVAPATLLNVTPLSVLTCHCTVGAGFPLAAAVKLGVAPTVTVWFTGFVVTAGAVLGTGWLQPAASKAPTNAIISSVRRANRALTDIYSSSVQGSGILSDHKGPKITQEEKKRALTTAHVCIRRGVRASS